MPLSPQFCNQVFKYSSDQVSFNTHSILLFCHVHTSPASTCLNTAWSGIKKLPNIAKIENINFKWLHSHRCTKDDDRS